MSWLDNFVYDLITAKGKRTSDYQYNILENTPYLHGTETLNQMYKSNKIWDDFRD